MANENDSQIIGYVASSYKIDADKITRDTTFDECGKGSMKMIALLAVIENEMDVEVPLREGMPRPRSRSLRPVPEPGGTDTSTVPPGVGALTLAPSAASQGATGSVM